MDKILEKHLANALVLVKSNLNISTPDENIISYESCILEDDKYNLITEHDNFSSEIIGYWKDKPIIIYNRIKYAILENSNTIVKLKSLNVNDDNIQKYPEKINSSNIIRKVEPVIIKKEIVKQEIPTPSPEEIIKQIDELLPKKETPTNSTISSYLDVLKKNDESEKVTSKDKESTASYIESDKPKSFEDEFFSIFETKKDDPRFKKLFAHYSEQTKKEVHEINEKYSKQYLAKILETSGGGGTSNSAVDYAKGGIIDGDLTVTSNLSVLGTIYGKLDNKKVFNIGNNTDTDYVLDHNFNTKDLVISVYDSQDELVLASVKNINTNQTLITFSSPPIETIKVVIIN
jgi:hypothetical protein